MVLVFFLATVWSFAVTLVIFSYVDIVWLGATFVSGNALIVVHVTALNVEEDLIVMLLLFDGCFTDAVYTEGFFENNWVAVSVFLFSRSMESGIPSTARSKPN